MRWSSFKLSSENFTSRINPTLQSKQSKVKSRRLSRWCSLIAVNTTLICSSVITVPTTKRLVSSCTHKAQFFNVVHVFAFHKAFQHIINGSAWLFDFDFVSLEKRHHDICIYVSWLVLFKVRVSKCGNGMRNNSRQNAAKVLRHTFPFEFVIGIQRSHGNAISVDSTRRKSTTRLIWETELCDIDIALDMRFAHIKTTADVVPQARRSVEVDRRFP